HIPTEWHNRLNCSAKLVLNINRQAMADYGFSPPTRVFEAAGAGACIVTDNWEGIETFLVPGEEVLVASSSEEVANYLSTISPERAKYIGRLARERVITEHSYERRGQQLQQLLNRLFNSIRPPNVWP
ncbi:MAG: glycosyltransferase family protein, partial [Chloroflexota bacterium]